MHTDFSYSKFLIYDLNSSRLLYSNFEESSETDSISLIIVISHFHSYNTGTSSKTQKSDDNGVKKHCLFQVNRCLARGMFSSHPSVWKLMVHSASNLPTQVRRSNALDNDKLHVKNVFPHPKASSSCTHLALKKTQTETSYSHDKLLLSDEKLLSN